MTNAEARRNAPSSARWRARRIPRGCRRPAPVGGGRVDDEMDEDDPAMSHDDALPELVDSSDDDEDGDEDVPLEDVPDLVDSSTTTRRSGRR